MKKENKMLLYSTALLLTIFSCISIGSKMLSHIEENREFINRLEMMPRILYNFFFYIGFLLFFVGIAGASSTCAFTVKYFFECDKQEVVK